MKETCPLCKKTITKCLIFQAILGTYPNDELVNYILRQVAEERSSSIQPSQ